MSTLHFYLKELDSCIFNFETSMIISKFSKTPQMSKLESDIVVLQKHLKTHDKKNAIAWASILVEDGQASFIHDQTL